MLSGSAKREGVKVSRQGGWVKRMEGFVPRAFHAARRAQVGRTCCRRRYDPRMASPRGIVLHPHPVLRAKARPVEKIDDFVRGLVDDMRRVAHELDGIGIAAPQLGESLRIFLTCGRENEPERVYINPRLELSGTPDLCDEGCLSLPDIRAEILRPTVVRITAQDIEGREFTLESSEFMGRVWQHEFDHLEGVLIIDRMRPLDRLANRRAIRDLERSAEGRRR